MSGRSSQRKGRAGELELAEFLRRHRYDARPGRALSYGEEPDVIGLPGVHIECKRAERLNLSAWMRQSVRDAERFGDGLPAVVHRKNREEWLVTMRLSDFVQLHQRK